MDGINVIHECSFDEREFEISLLVRTVVIRNAQNVRGNVALIKSQSANDFIFNQKVKSRKRLRQDAVQLSASQKVLEASNSRRGWVQSEVELLKSDMTNAHLKKMLSRVLDEQNRYDLETIFYRFRPPKLEK
jgi:hypothetical protein